MRNIIEFPITKEEILETLRRIQESYIIDIESTGMIGNMTPAVLQEAIKIIADSK